jgi:hypothetical protein
VTRRRAAHPVTVLPRPGPHALPGDLGEPVPSRRRHAE